jgi:hypothetical protein
MRARRLARPLVLLLALAFVLPLAGLEGECDDCLTNEAPDCCPPSCSLCLCCVQSPTVLRGAPGMDRAPGVASPSADSSEGALLAADPRDVFHVPKASL